MESDFEVQLVELYKLCYLYINQFDITHFFCLEISQNGLIYCTCSIQPILIATLSQIVTVSCMPKNWRISYFDTKNGYNGASMVDASNNPLLQRTFPWNWIQIPNFFFCGKGFILGYIIYSWLLLCFQRDGKHFNQLNLLINLHDHM